MKVEMKDIIDSKELGDGFLIIHNEAGYFLGVREKEGPRILQTIDRETFNSLERREGNRY
jgi:hypothetical protein